MTRGDDFRALQVHLARWDARRRQATLLIWLPRAVAAALLSGWLWLWSPAPGRCWPPV